MSLSSEVPLTLITVASDLHIKICEFLHPSDILALRQTCKTLQVATKQRTIWIGALHKVCLDNTLFLPSFPIPNMSDLELEQAAMAPHRWITRCATFATRYSVDSDARLCPTTTRIIWDPMGGTDSDEYRTGLFLVPGGRYLLIYSSQGMGVWDLGYTLNSDCKLLASIGPEAGSTFRKVNDTSDGMGLVIVTFLDAHCSVYEIYPQSETPQFTQVAHLDFTPSRNCMRFVLPEKVIWYISYEDRVVFTVWDYRLNHSISFSTDIDVDEWYLVQVIPTMTTIIVLCEEEMLVFAIPPLSPQLPDFFDYSPTYTPPLFRTTFPDNLVRQTGFINWEPMPSWYSGSSKPLYLDALLEGLKLYGVEIVIKPDLSDVSLHVMHTCRLIPYDYEYDSTSFRTYGICEDNLVSRWDIVDPNQCRIQIRPISSHPANLISAGGPIVLNVSLPGTLYPQNPASCPASGRFVHLDRNDSHRVVIVDFLPYP